MDVPPRSITGGVTLHGNQPRTSPPDAEPGRPDPSAVPEPLPAATLGSCAGHRVEGRLPLRTLRDGVAGGMLTVAWSPDTQPDGDLVARWDVRPGNPFEGRLLRDGRRFAFWASDGGWYLVDPAEGAIGLVEDGRPLTLTREVRLFGIPATLVALERGDVVLHAAAVEVDGRAVVLAGPSRQGKTTLAAAFAAAGHRLLTEDMTRCVPGTPAVYPGPSVVRLRPDVAGAVRIGDAVPVVERERLFVPLDGVRRGDGAAVPLAAILFLREAPGPAVVEPVAAADAIRDLWSLAFTLPTDEGRATVFGRVADLAVRVPVLDLRRELRFETLPEVIGLVTALVERLRASEAT